MNKYELKARLWSIIRTEGIEINNQNIDKIIDRIYKERKDDLIAAAEVDEWVSVDDDTPPLYCEVMKTYSNRSSRKVIAKLSTGETVEAYYDYYEWLWRYTSNSRPIKESVIAWKDL